MEYRSLGRTGIRVSLLGLGTGGANLFGQALGAEAREARLLALRALELGVNCFDTARAYRDSETRLAAALAGVPRGDYVLASKYQPQTPDGTLLTGAEVEAAMQSSLGRLGTDMIDVFYVHALKAGAYDAVMATHLPVLLRAREAGLIRAIGVTESFAGDDPRHETLARAVRQDEVDVIMVGYNVLHQNAERDILPMAAARGVGVVVMAAVRRALASPAALEAQVAALKASGDLRPDAVPDADPLGWLVNEETPSVQAACYGYVAGGPAVATVLTGTFSREHLEENAAAVGSGPLPAADRARLQAIFGHLELGLGK